MLCELLAYSRDEEWVTDFWRANSISNTLSLSLHTVYSIYIHIYYFSDKNYWSIYSFSCYELNIAIHYLSANHLHSSFTFSPVYMDFPH